MLRADLAPSTQDQPNPIINAKEGSNEQFVTLDYRVQLLMSHYIITMWKMI